MMESSSIMGSEEFDAFETPSKAASRLTPGKRSINEENKHNGVHTTNSSMMNKRTKESPNLESCIDRDHATSDCATDISSISGRPNFCPRNMSLPPCKSPPNQQKTKKVASSSSAAASVLVQRLVDNKLTSSNVSRSVAFTPVRMKPRIDKNEVQATNDGYASVAKLSAWLADDPTSTKKLRHVRKGRNVIAKSRKFEKDMEGIIVEEAQISKGAVSDKKKWLSGAFHNDDDKDIGGVRITKGAVSDRKKWLQGAFREEDQDGSVRYARSEVGGYLGGYKGTPGRRQSNESSSRSEIITDDAASMMSVSDKKDWLKNAFKGTASVPSKFGSAGFPTKARSEVLHCRGDRRDDISSRAKKKWSELSARKLAEKKASVEVAPPEKICEDEERTGPPEATTEILAAVASNVLVEPTTQTTKVLVDEDRTQLDFSAARKILLKRSKENGNELHILSKFHRRKEKFEKMERESRRRSGPKGLLKPSWGVATPSKGRPSDAYTKSYVEDIAPKKSFEELP